MGKVIAIIIIVALGALVVYELISLAISVIKKFKKKNKTQVNDDVIDENVEKGK